MFRFPAGAKNFLYLRKVQAGPGAHPASHSMVSVYTTSAMFKATEARQFYPRWLSEWKYVVWPYAMASGARFSKVQVTRKDKGHPGTGHEGPEAEYSTLSLTSALDGVGWSRPRHITFPPGKRSGTHCTGGCVGPTVGQVRCGKSRPHRDSIPSFTENTFHNFHCVKYC